MPQERSCLADFGLACPMDALEDAPQVALGNLAAQHFLPHPTEPLATQRHAIRLSQIV
jgi:hypothetical protein